MSDRIKRAMLTAALIVASMGLAWLVYPDAEGDYLTFLCGALFGVVTLAASPFWRD